MVSWELLLSSVVTDSVKYEKLPVPMTPSSMIGDIKLHHFD